MTKSPEAFRTISEVSAFLETPPHVLRFWESKFTQVKPVKRAGGRRYYRPDDIALLGGIKVLLHEQGMTIRGVQKMLREQGVRYVSSLAPQGWDGAEGSGVIIGPWRGPGVDPGMDDLDTLDAEGDDLAALSLEDGATRAEEEYDGEVVDLMADEEGVASEARMAEPEAEPVGAAAGSGGQSLIFDFLAGTIDHFAASAPARPEPAITPGREPLEPGEPTLDRALRLLRRADPVRLRARAERIEPLLVRLRALAGEAGSQRL